MRPKTKIQQTVVNYRKFYENQTGCKVPKGFDVHHIDLDRSNNDIENLVAIPKYIHTEYHKLLPYVIDPVKISHLVQSSTECGHMHNDFISERIRKFSVVFNECIMWMDLRNHFLGKHHDFHGLKNAYLKDY